MEQSISSDPGHVFVYQKKVTMGKLQTLLV